MVTQEQAKSLAIAYQAFHEAATEKRDAATRTWAHILLKIQKETGIELFSNAALERYWVDFGRAA